ncbi:MAG: peptidylprolyl isomerase [Pseudomonadota bacterium]
MILLRALLLVGILGAANADEFTATVTDPVYPDALFPQVLFETSAGDFTVELDRRRAPVTVDNFLRYVEAETWNGTIFHRVIEGFVVQGGGYLPDATPIETRQAIMNESGNGLTNRKRAIAMARYEDPHSATSQFYFNLADNESLDPNRRNWGYTVFGQVIEGFEVVEAIGAVATDYSDAIGAGDVPVEAITLRRVTLTQQ